MNKKTIPYEPEIDEPLAAIAQGIINIDAGITNIEKGSRVYKGMLAIIEMRQAGRLVLPGRDK